MKIVKRIFKIIFCLVILGTLIFLYSKYLNATGFKVHEYTIYNKELPNEFDGIKLVQISDIHYMNSVKKEELKKIIDKINLTKPDIVVLTGDLLDNKINYKDKDIEYLIKQLNNIECSIDKFIISGNTDNSDKWQTIVENTDFININDTYQLIYHNKKPILINGLSTSSNDINVAKKIESSNNYLKNNNIYSILILHEPDIIKKIDYEKYNLILAGHSHGGQFKLPFIGGLIIKDGAKKYINEHYKLKNTDLYISNGLGNSNINYRFLNKPSFNLFRLRMKSVIDK